MAETPVGAPAVTDNRTTPRGALPRGTQTWLMIGLAVLILGIIVVTGRPAPGARATMASTPPSVTPSPDRLREYQDRLRALDERSRQQAQSVASTPAPAGVSYGEPRRETPADPIAEDRKRREYDSFFASNVVLSRRADASRLTTNNEPAHTRPSARAGVDTTPVVPNLDEIAEAVVRASGRRGDAPPPATAPPPGVPPPPVTDAPKGRSATRPIQSSGALHRLAEGTLIDTVLTNRLDGGIAAPVNCLVTNPVYSHDEQFVLIPAGSRVLGTTRSVQAVGDTRLAVAFHRLVLPDGQTFPLEQFIGLNQIGDAGLRDQVNAHYAATFGASAAVGLISGLGQWLGSAGLGRSTGDRTVVIAGGVADSTTQATAQTMSRFLNRLPTVTIREGHRVKVYLTSDLELPAYATTSR